MIKIENLHVEVEGNKILKGINLEVKTGETHAIMGPNGSGRSTLAQVLAAHEDSDITEGTIEYLGKDLLEMDVDERACEGVFLAFQYPAEVPGVTMANFIRAALQARLPEGEELDAVSYYKNLYAKMDQLGIDRRFTSRFVNEGFSGGEKKRNEVQQMMMLEPSYCLMDETDSGLDIDALKVVADGVNSMRSPDRGFLVITHYQRLLDYIEPDHVHVLADGQIVRSGTKELARELENKGYDFLKEELEVAG